MDADSGLAMPPAALVLAQSVSSTHNESRLAACPLSGVPERACAPVN